MANQQTQSSTKIQPSPGVAHIQERYLKRVLLPEQRNASENSGPPRKKQRGQNKNRPRDKRVPPSERLCPSIKINHDCSFGEGCHFSHNITTYMANKPPDIGERCVLFELHGECPYGLECRFGKSHISSDFKNIKRDNSSGCEQHSVTHSWLSKELQEKLHKKLIKFPRSEKFLSKSEPTKDSPSKPNDCNDAANNSIDAANNSIDATNESIDATNNSIDAANNSINPANNSIDDEGQICKRIGPVSDEDIVKLRTSEKKMIDFRGKRYLAPLTTVGNLPFRRICKQYGAEITCGEMSMCTNLLQGKQSEWALLKRHSSEDLFGVQLCGGFADTMSRCAELINTYASVDFIDINVGCPIDLIFKMGAGSALMTRHTRFETIVRGMVKVLDIPLTVKMRTGIHDKNWNAHKLLPKLRDWGVTMATVHGRSREQRYTKLADYDYLMECADAASPMPLFANGDILSFEDYNTRMSTDKFSGLLIGRGALIKPWLFTEIKEQRHWDISSSERLDMLRSFVDHGLEHWGSDTQGVDKTRRFLLEWLSFLYRYIPVGVLERVPQKINERPPAFVGRDDLETMMSSNNCDDWIKISEMLLGPVQSSFNFLPKHKANSYQ